MVYNRFRRKDVVNYVTPLFVGLGHKVILQLIANLIYLKTTGVFTTAEILDWFRLGIYLVELIYVGWNGWELLVFVDK